MHPLLRAKFFGFWFVCVFVLAYERLMQKKRFSEPKKYNEVLKMSVKIPC